MINSVRMLGALMMVFVITENLLGVSAHDFAQEATLFSNYEQNRKTGNNVFLDQSYYPDLRKQNFDRQARSTCVKGVWLFYASRDYSHENEQMEYYYHVGEKENCVSFRNIGGRVSSARYAGYANNYRGNTLTVYAKTYFSAGQKMVDQDNSDVGFKGVSFIVTGNFPWTIYSEQGFRGYNKCVHTQTSNYVPDFIHDTSTIGFPYGIRSVKIGCKN